MSTTEAYPRLMDGLNDLRRQWRTQKVMEGLFLAAAGVLAVLVVTVAADNVFHMGTLGRTFLAVVLWGTLVAGLFALVIRRVLEDRRDDFFAVLVEQKH